MAILKIPTSTTIADYKEEVELDGVTYGFRFRWNQRAAAWFIDISDDEGNVIAYGRRVTANALIVGQLHHLTLPAGEIVPFDTTLRRTDPGIDDFGSRVILLYLDTDEIAEIKAS